MKWKYENYGITKNANTNLHLSFFVFIPALLILDITKWNVLSCKSLLEEVILWTEDSYFIHKQMFEVKPSDLYICFLHTTYNFSLHKMLNDVEYCDVFIRLSFWRHPFTAEHPLLRHWCSVTYFQICSLEETNSSTSWLAWGWGCFQQVFIFGWTKPTWVRVNTGRILLVLRSLEA